MLDRLANEVPSGSETWLELRTIKHVYLSSDLFVRT